MTLPHPQPCPARGMHPTASANAGSLWMTCLHDLPCRYRTGCCWIQCYVRDPCTRKCEAIKRPRHSVATVMHWRRSRHITAPIFLGSTSVDQRTLSSGAAPTLTPAPCFDGEPRGRCRWETRNHRDVEAIPKPSSSRQLLSLHSASCVQAHSESSILSKGLRQNELTL